MREDGIFSRMDRKWFLLNACSDIFEDPPEAAAINFVYKLFSKFSNYYHQ